MRLQVKKKKKKLIRCKENFIQLDAKILALRWEDRNCKFSKKAALFKNLALRSSPIFFGFI
jgi:hypothetical protein